MKVQNVQISQQVSKVSLDQVTLNNDQGQVSSNRKLFKDNSSCRDRNNESQTHLNSQIFSQKNFQLPVQSMLNKYPDQRSSPSGRSKDNSLNDKLEDLQAIASIPYIGKNLPSITTKKENRQDAPFAQPRQLSTKNQTLPQFFPKDKNNKSQRQNKIIENSPATGVTQKLTYFNSTIKTDTIYEDNTGDQQKLANAPSSLQKFKKINKTNVSTKINSPMGRDNRTYKTINTYYNKGNGKQKKTIQKDESKHSEIMQKLSIRDMKTNPAASLDKLIHEIDVYANDFILDKMQNKRQGDENSNGNNNWTSLTKHHITVNNKGHNTSNNTYSMQNSLANSRDSSVVSNKHKKLDKNFPNISYSTQSGSWYPNNKNRARINNTEMLSSKSKPTAMRNTNQSHLFHILEDSQSIEQDNNQFPGRINDMSDDSEDHGGTFQIEKNNVQTPQKSKSLWNKKNTRAETKTIHNKFTDLSKTMNSPLGGILQTCSTPEQKLTKPSKNEKLRGSHQGNILVVELDYERLTNKEKILQLPSVIKTSKTTKNKDNENDQKKYDFKLPKNFKYTNDPKYQDIEAMRQRMRKNRIEHDKFSAVIGSQEGKKYYNEDVYKLNEPTYVTIDVNEVDRKNKLLHYTKSLYARDPNEIDLVRDAEELEKKNRKNHVEVDSVIFSDEEEKEIYEKNKREKEEMKKYESESESSDGPNEDDIEQNLFKKVLKNGPPKVVPQIQSTSVVKGSPKPQFDEKKTTEQIEREKMFQRELERTVPQNLCKEFQSHMVKTDTGELKINLGRSSEIEQKLKEVGSLKKFVPPNYSGSLREFVKEANEMMEAGFELDHDYIKMITTKPFDELWKEKRQRKALEEKRRKERRFRRQDTIDSENSFVKGLQTKKSAIEAQWERDQDASLAKQHKIEQGLEELSKTKKYQAAAAKFDDAYIYKLACNHSVEQALAIIRRAVESVEVEDSDDSSYQRRQAKPTFSKMRVLPKLEAYNAAQKKHNPHLYDEDGNMISEGRESQMLKSVIDTPLHGEAGRGPAFLDGGRGSHMSVLSPHAMVQGSLRNVFAHAQQFQQMGSIPENGDSKLKKMKSQLPDPTNQEMQEMLDGIVMMSNSELSDDHEQSQTLEQLRTFQTKSPSKMKSKNNDDVMFNDLVENMPSSPGIKQTKTSKLRRAANLMAENQIHEQFNLYCKKKMLELSKRKNKLRKTEEKEMHKRNAMRENHLKNSLTAGVSNKLSVKSQKTHNLIQKAIAIQNLAKLNNSQTKLSSPTNIKMHSPKNRAVHRSLDITQLIQKSVSPKVQLEIKFNDSLQQKYRQSINNQKHQQISVDITKNRKINEIKNMLNNQDNDTFIKYDVEEPKLKKARVMRQKTGKNSQQTSSRDPNSGPLSRTTSVEEFQNQNEESSVSVSKQKDSILQTTIQEDVNEEQENESSFRTDTGTDMVRSNQFDEYDSSIEDQFDDTHLMDMARQMEKSYGSPNKKNSSLQLLRKKLTMKQPKKLDESLTRGLTFISKHANTSKSFTAEEIKMMRMKLRRVGSKLNTNLDSIMQQIEDKKEEMMQKKLRNTKNQARSYQNRRNLTVIMRSIEKQFQDQGWVDQTEPKRDKLLKGIEVEENRLKTCIESYMYLINKATSDKDAINQLTSEELFDLMPQINEILKESKEKDQYDFENFLSPKMIALYQQINTRNAQKTQQFQNNQAPNIWKPNKLKLNYDIFEEEKKV